ncbi:MAG: Mur ligase family protein [Pirellulales bacterium]
MEIRKVLTLRGPSIWSLNPVFEAWFDQRDLSVDSRARASNAALWSEKLTHFCMTVHGNCDAGCARDAGWQPLHQESEAPRILGRVALELQRALGGRVSTMTVASMNEAGVYQVVVGYEDERLGRACLDFAVDFVKAVVKGGEFDVASGWSQLRQNALAWRLPAATAAILNAAAARNVPILKSPDAEVWQLGWGNRQHRFQGALTDRTSAVAESLLRDPNVVWRLLQAAGVPMFDPDEAVPLANHHILVANQRCVSAVRQVTADPEGAAPRWVEVEEAFHPELVIQLVEGARMLGLDVAEFALAAPDLTAPLDGQARGVVSVASRPNLEQFCSPSTESAQRVGQAIMDGLFPAGQTGRIPVIAVTGVNGKTTTIRLCAHIVATSGKRVGFTCTDGIYVAGRRVDVEDCSGPRSARNVLMNPTLEAAVLETARGGILREGLAFDRCDVAVVTNIGEGDHLGLNGVDTKEQLARVKRTIVDAVSPQGTAVLKADDPLTAEMAAHCPGSVVYFCRDPEHPVMATHRGLGGRVVFVRDNSIVVAEGQLEIPLLSLERIPLTHNGKILFQVENVLAATAANWALGIPAEVIRNGLESFSASLDKSPGRFNLVEIGGATVVVDYGHNTSSLKAMLETLAQFPHARRLAVYSAAGDRRDCDMVDQGALLGEAFDEVILYEDHYIRGRQPGDITRLFQTGLSQGKRVQQVTPVQGWELAVETVLRRMQPGDLVLLQADTIDGAVEVMKKHLTVDAAAREVNLKDALKTSQTSSHR